MLARRQFEGGVGSYAYNVSMLAETADSLYLHLLDSSGRTDAAL